MPKCAVKKCKNNTHKTNKHNGVSYFHFPKNCIQREKWREIIANERKEIYYEPNDSSVVCSDHFTEGDMYLTTKGFRRIQKLAVPKVQDYLISILEEGTGQPSSTIPEGKPSPGSTIPLDYSNIDVSPKDLYSSVQCISNTKFEAEIKSVPDSKKAQEHSNVISTTDITRNNDPTPSPNLSEKSSTLNSSRAFVYINTIEKYRKQLDLKTKQVKNLKNKNQRLLNKNKSLKRIIHNLLNKILVDH